MSDENPVMNLMVLKEAQALSTEVEQPELQELYQTNPLIGAGGLLDTLSDNQQRFLVAKMYGSSDAAAARAVGVNVHTMYGWKQNDPEFRQVYEMVVNQPLEMAAHVSAFGFAKAVDKIAKMMDSNDVKVVMWAIEKMLTIASVGKQRIEVTHKKERNDDDMDRILRELEQRRNADSE